MVMMGMGNDAGHNVVGVKHRKFEVHKTRHEAWELFTING